MSVTGCQLGSCSTGGWHKNFRERFCAINVKYKRVIGEQAIGDSGRGKGRVSYGDPGG